MARQAWNDTVAFRRLQSQWDRKLAETGFADVEHRSSGRYLKRDPSAYRYDSQLHAYHSTALSILPAYLHSRPSFVSLYLASLHSEGLCVERLSRELHHGKATVRSALAGFRRRLGEALGVTLPGSGENASEGQPGAVARRPA